MSFDQNCHGEFGLLARASRICSCASSALPAASAARATMARASASSGSMAMAFSRPACGQFRRVFQRSCAKSRRIVEVSPGQGHVRRREFGINRDGTLKELLRPLVIGSGFLSVVPLAAQIRFPCAEALRRLCAGRAEIRHRRPPARLP